MKIFKDKFTNKDKTIEGLLSNFTLERLYSISAMYPMSDQDYYYTIIINHLMNQKYFDLTDMHLDFEQIAYFEIFSFKMKRKEFFHIKLKVGIMLEGETLITTI